MPRLLVNPGTPEERAISLPQGSITLGRSPACDAAIDDESVSGTHCQIVTNGESVIIKDLNSTNGTFIDDDPVTESILKPGQRLRFGNIVAELIADPPRAPSRGVLHVTVGAAAPPPPSVTASYLPDEYSEAVEAPVPCRFHHDSLARYLCPECQKPFCELCVSRMPGGKRTGMFCRKCSTECVALNVALIAPVNRYADFFAALPGMFVFPFKGDGVIFLISGAVFFGILDIVNRFAGFYAIWLHVLCWGYLFSFMQHVVQTAAQGSDELVSWSMVTNFYEDLVLPFLRIFLISVLCFAPATFLAFAWEIDLMTPGAVDLWQGILFGAVLLGGAAYYPMAILAVSMFDSVVALNPMVVVPAMFRAAKEYATVLVLLAIIFAIQLGGEYAAGLLKIPLLPHFVASGLGLYFLIVAMRMLGLMYYARREEIGWFSR